MIADYFGITEEELLGEYKEQNLEYWQNLCREQQREIETLKAQLAENRGQAADSDKLKEALKLIVDAVADLVEERSRKA